jgi:CDP-4-dehydro-6-deoxyglucose reductase
MKPQRTQAKVDQITPLTDSIVLLVLKPEQYIDYEAGQYLNILGVHGQDLSYSIANAPLGAQHYELHIRHSPDNPHTQALFAQIKKMGHLSIELPYGCCSITNLDPDLPILFIAGGTGFAPIQAMIEQLLATQDPRAFELFWGARTQSDVYLDEKVLHWQSHVAHFTYYSFLSEISKEKLVSHFLMLHAEDLTAWQIVLSGPFEMIYSIRDVLIDRGMPARQLFSDAFSFEQ